MNQCSLGSILVVNGCNIIGRSTFNCFILYVEVGPDESANADQIHIQVKTFGRF